MLRSVPADNNLTRLVMQMLSISFPIKGVVRLYIHIQVRQDSRVDKDVRFGFEPRSGLLVEFPVFVGDKVLPDLTVARPVRTQRFISAVRTPKFCLERVFSG